MQPNQSKQRILLVQQEMRKWSSAKMWGYNFHLGIEEGFAANNVEYTTLISSWMPRARELLAGKTFDQIWFNDATHMFEAGGWDDYRLTRDDLEWLSTLAPVRIGFLIESLNYSEEDYKSNPFLYNVKQVLPQTMQFFTHVMVCDEKDLDEVRAIRPIPVAWFVCPIPRRLICEKVEMPPQTKPVFFGTSYGKRADWLESAELRDLLEKRSSADNSTDLPDYFEKLHGELLPAMLKEPSVQPLYDEYLKMLRIIRSEAYQLYLESLREGCAVVALPSLGRTFTGSVYEGMAIGRPVIAPRHQGTERLLSLYRDEKELLLYSPEDPRLLANQIQRLLQQPELGFRLATSAQEKVLRYNTIERLVEQVLYWVETGEAPKYDEDLAMKQPVSRPLWNPQFGVSKPLKLHFVLDMTDGQAQFSPHFGIAQLSAYLKQRMPALQVTVSYLSDEDILGDIQHIRPDIIGFTSTSRRFLKMVRLAKKVKAAYDCPIMWGGVHLGIAPYELPSFAQVGVIGEGEETVFELLSNFNGTQFEGLARIKGIVYYQDGKVTSTERRPLIDDLDSLPTPDLDLLRVRWQDYRRAVLLSSRGCPFKCRFCASSIFWDRARLHSAEYVVEHIKSLVKRYNAESILIYDDFFTINKKRVARIADLITASPELRNIQFECLSRVNGFDAQLAQDLKRMGCNKVSFGFESGCQRNLDYLKNGKLKIEESEAAVAVAKAHGIMCVGSFVIGSPYETEEEIEQTFSFIKKLNLDNVQVTVATPFPGTELWNDGKKTGAITSDEWKDQYYVMFAFAELDNDGVTVREFLEGKILLTQIDRERFIRLVERSRELQMSINNKSVKNVNELVDQINKNFAIAQRLFGQRKFEESLVITDTLLALYPEIADLKYFRAELKFEQGDIRAAKAELEDIISKWPDHLRAYHLLGRLNTREGNVLAALQMFTRASAINPDDRLTILACGEFFKGQKQENNARIFYSSYLMRHPEDFEMRQLLSQLS